MCVCGCVPVRPHSLRGLYDGGSSHLRCSLCILCVVSDLVYLMFRVSQDLVADCWSIPVNLNSEFIVSEFGHLVLAGLKVTSPTGFGHLVQFSWWKYFGRQLCFTRCTLHTQHTHTFILLQYSRGGSTLGVNSVSLGKWTELGISSLGRRTGHYKEKSQALGRHF